MQVNKEMEKENTIVDFNRVFTSISQWKNGNNKGKMIWYLVKTRKNTHGHPQYMQLR